jgi:hypothetical protein
MSDKDQLIRQHESSIRGHVQFSRMSGGNSDGQKERAMKFQKMHAALEKKHQTHVAESMKDVNILLLLLLFIFDSKVFFFLLG